VTRQWERYSHLVLKLFPAECPDHVPVCARILNLLGAKFTLSKDAKGDPDIAVELTITAAAAQPWFDDSMLEMLQALSEPDPSLFFDDEQKQRPLRVVESSLRPRGGGFFVSCLQAPSFLTPH
jgi:hypothetical protein